MIILDSWGCFIDLPESDHIFFPSPFIVIADLCRHQYNNRETQFCCNGTLYSRNKEISCCGGKREREWEREFKGWDTYWKYLRMIFVIWYLTDLIRYNFATYFVDVIYRNSDKICCESNTLHEKYVQSGENEGKEQICCGINIFLVDQSGGKFVMNGFFKIVLCFVFFWERESDRETEKGSNIICLYFYNAFYREFPTSEITFYWLAFTESNYNTHESFHR